MVGVQSEDRFRLSADAGDAIARLITTIRRLPSPPEVCLEVLQAAQDNTTTVADLEEIIAADAALSARLLQVVNSAFFGQSQPVTSIHRAVMLLGFGAVKMLALGFYLQQQFSDACPPGLDYPHLPQYALAASVVAETLAEQLAPARAAEAASLALLHECGVVVMALALGEQYGSLARRRAEEDRPMHQLELEQFGFDHATVGSMLLSHWRLGETFIQAVGDHHRATPAEGIGPDGVLLWKILRVSSSAALMFFPGQAARRATHTLRLARAHFDLPAEQLCALVGRAGVLFRKRGAIFSSGRSHTGVAPDQIATRAATMLAEARDLLAEEPEVLP